MDTIFALATAPGKSSISVIRISGSRSDDVFAAFGLKQLPERGLYRRKLTDLNGEMIDDAVVLVFRAPDSFTGENIIELQTHGSSAIQSKLLSILSALPRFRLAEPGEFTRRALLNGKMDLAQVEGLADLIDAETEAQRSQAVRVFSGAMGARVSEWRGMLVRALALVEAGIDFSDEDIPEDLLSEVASLLRCVLVDLRAQLTGAKAAERVRKGFDVVIVGAPNAGKSTLLNRLAGREAALVSEQPGTTRDAIEVHMEMSGLPVTLTDTAGLRESRDQLENLGIDRTMMRARTADLRIFLVETGEVSPVAAQPGDIVRRSKGDLYPGVDAVSGLTGFGVGSLVQEIGDRLSGRVKPDQVLTRERHRQALSQGAMSLARLVEIESFDAMPAELVAVGIQDCLNALDSLIGHVGVEDLLSEIFSSFCIGK